jgi:hypothetical protein
MALAIGAIAAFAPAQNADKNTSGPTKNTYRLRVVEPAEGATISGERLQVVVDLRPPAELDGDRRDVHSTPRPRVDVFVDNDNKGTLADTTNVLTIDGVPAGSHKLVVLAKNLSGEIIDRKEVNFLVEPGASAAASAFSRPADIDTSARATESVRPMTAPPAPERPAIVEPSRPAPAQSLSTEPSSPVLTARNAPPPQESLPETASYDPLLAAGGLALLATGVALHRRA